MTIADGIWQQIVNFDNYGELLALVRNSLIAGAALGLVGGLVGVFVIMRDLPFAVHGISELSFAGWPSQSSVLSGDDQAEADHTSQLSPTTLRRPGDGPGVEKASKVSP